MELKIIFTAQHRQITYLSEISRHMRNYLEISGVMSAKYFLKRLQWLLKLFRPCPWEKGPVKTVSLMRL